MSFNLDDVIVYIKNPVNRILRITGIKTHSIICLVTYTDGGNSKWTQVPFNACKDYRLLKDAKIEFPELFI